MSITQIRSATTLLQAPWGPTVGVARSLVYVATALTLLLTSADVNFMPLNGVEPLSCGGFQQALLFCVVPEPLVPITAKCAGLILLALATGYLPRIGALVATYIVTSFVLTTSLADGGDQIASILLLLLLGNGLTDNRRNFFHRLDSADFMERNEWAVSVASVSLFCAKLQISVVYLFASIGKLNSPEWTDGSSIYYWVKHLTFGAPVWLETPINFLFSFSFTTQAVTWGTLALEFALGISMLLGPRVKRWLLVVAVLFHLGIMFVLGISSFALVMIGAAVLLLAPIESGFAALNPRNLVRGPKSIQPTPDKVMSQ